MKSPHAHPIASARAFTLVEVLMAVLILAIGLLGLGAVLPMVVRQQRDSADGTFGLIAMRSAVTAGPEPLAVPTTNSGRLEAS